MQNKNKKIQSTGSPFGFETSQEFHKINSVDDKKNLSHEIGYPD